MDIHYVCQEIGSIRLSRVSKTNLQPYNTINLYQIEISSDKSSHLGFILLSDPRFDFGSVWIAKQL